MLLGLATGHLNLPISATCLAAGTLAGIWVWRHYRREYRLIPEMTTIPALFFSFLVFVSFQHFRYLLYSGQQGLRTLHLNNFGDLSMHIQFIRHMAGGAHFWPENPEYAGELLRYPLGIDLYNALWEALGIPMADHLFVVGLTMTIVALSLLYRWMGWWGIGAFFMNAGLSNWQCLLKGRLFDFQNEVAWKNFFLSVWITQRGFLYAIPAGAYLTKTMTEVFLEERILSRLEKTVCAIIWSGLAWFHLHSFFVVSLFLGICMVLYKKLRSMAGVYVPAMIVGGLFVVFSTDFFSKAGAIHLSWNWVAGKENFISFWLVNLGPWIVLWGVAVATLLNKANARVRPMAFLAFVLFLVFTFVMLAPWNWDNIKVLLWMYLLLAWLINRTFLVHLRPLALSAIGVVAFFPGAVSLISSLPGNNSGVELYRTEDIKESKLALSNVPKDAVLAVDPIPNHPAVFWGAKVAMSYPGHLWSHGINYSIRESKLEDLLKGRINGLNLARDIGVTHIYWGDNERKKYGVFDPPWRDRLKNVSRSAKIDVYEIK